MYNYCLAMANKYTPVTINLAFFQCQLTRHCISGSYGECAEKTLDAETSKNRRAG